MNEILEKIQKFHFFLIMDGVKRAKYLKKKNILRGIGKNCLFQSRNFPMDPKCVLIHDNVTIAAKVDFVTHDAIRHVLSYKYKKDYDMNLGCIEIMDNVFIGLGTIIMPNVRINENVIVAAGSVVTKDIPSNSVVAGVPARVIGTFDDLNSKREKIHIKNNSKDELIQNIWDDFYNKRIK